MSSKKILLTFLAVLLISSAAVIVSDQKKLNNLGLLVPRGESKIHLAGNPAISLKDVTAKVVYFIPSDLAAEAEADWLSAIDKTMRAEQNFFKFQLNNTMKFNYEIYGSPVVGNENHLFYDSTSTDRGNPHALIAVREEIMKRIFSSDGDRYEPEFAKPARNYEFIIIIYGGTGASAMIYKQNNGGGEDVVKIEDSGPPAIILSSAFLTSPLYREFGGTILAHEIGHALGLTDSYDAATGANLETDVMGEGRRRILTATYISEKNKKLLGL